jgi:hypothetical protein
LNPLFPNNGVSNGTVNGGLTDQNAAVPPGIQPPTASGQRTQVPPRLNGPVTTQ